MPATGWWPSDEWSISPSLPAERHLRFGIQAEPRKHQHAVVLERIEDRVHRAPRRLASRSESTPSTSAPTESVSLLIVSRLMVSYRHGTGALTRSMTASAESAGFWVPKTSTAIDTMIIE